MFVGQIKNLFIHLDRRLLSWAAVLCILVIIYGYVYDFCCKQGSNPMTSYMLLRECPVTREQTLKPRSYGLGTTALRAKKEQAIRNAEKLSGRNPEQVAVNKRKTRQKHRQCNAFE